MPTRTSYAQGTPCWVDLQTTDQEAAKAFYAGLFGWSYDDQPVPPGTSYSIALLGGESVAAIAPQPTEMAQAQVPPVWNTYIAVSSVDDAAARVKDAGGEISMAPADVMQAGRVAFVLDPGGAPVALWEAREVFGAARVNEPGAVAWNELVTADPGASVGFYEQVLGMTAEVMDAGGQEYTVFKVGDRMVGGAMATPMPGVPNHWQVYFAVADADRAAEKTAELGGSVMVPPFDTPFGRMAVLADAQGAVFSIVHMSMRGE